MISRTEETVELLERARSLSWPSQRDYQKAITWYLTGHDIDLDSFDPEEHDFASGPPQKYPQQADTPSEAMTAATPL